MHILYTDESETDPVGTPERRFFILAGVSLFERGTYHLSKKLDEIAAQFCPDAPQNIELHGTHMRTGKYFWRKQPLEARVEGIKKVLYALADFRSAPIFAVVVEQGAVDEHPMEYAFKQIASRFDQYLGRLQYQRNEPQRGIILMDKSSHEKTIQSATRVYRNEGHEWGKLKYQAEVPVFVDSRSSRLIQLADIVAYSINRKIAHDDEQFYNIIQSRFDFHDGKLHGLHIKRNGGD